MHERCIATAAVRSILTCWLHSLAHSRFRCSCSATRTTEQDTDEGRQGHTLAHTVMHERRIATAAVRSILTCWLHSLRSEEHKSELQSLMRKSSSVYRLKKKN